MIEFQLNDFNVRKKKSEGGAGGRQRSLRREEEQDDIFSRSGQKHVQTWLKNSPHCLLELIISWLRSDFLPAASCLQRQP